MKWTQATVRSFRPAQVLVVGFAALIVVGTVLLMLPIATADGSIPAFLLPCSQPLPPSVSPGWWW